MQLELLSNVPTPAIAGGILVGLVILGALVASLWPAKVSRPTKVATLPPRPLRDEEDEAKWSDFVAAMDQRERRKNFDRYAWIIIPGAIVLGRCLYVILTNSEW